MSQEELNPQPDCPYPAFQEISIEEIGQGLILTGSSLIGYLKFVASQESRHLKYPSLKPSLSNACSYILEILEPGHFVLSEPLNIHQVLSYESSDILMNYSDPDFPGITLAQYGAIGFLHGGFTGLNGAHYEILGNLALRTLPPNTNRLILLGLERNEYLQTKSRETIRPWPLIVTVSIYAHLASIYHIPLRIFIMPIPPLYPKKINAHYTEIYRRILKYNKKTTLVTSPKDLFVEEKIKRMRKEGLTPSDWAWTQINKIISVSTGLILTDRDGTYSNLFAGDFSDAVLSEYFALPPMYPSIHMWDTLYLFRGER